MHFVKIKTKIQKFNKVLSIEGDKSLSIRWALIASQSEYKSKSENLLLSEDVINTLKCLKKLGVKVKISKNFCEINGVGLNGFKYKKNLILNAGNSGTLGRLIMGLLTHSKRAIKLKGDKSLSKRDFQRIIKPLKKFGADFKSNLGKLPIIIKGTNNPNPIVYNETKGSAQVKSSLMLAALNTSGETIIKAKKSRDHSELLFKYLKLPIKVKKIKDYDLIKIKGKKKIPALNYKLPSDISSCAFFIVLTILSKNSKLKIRNVNINPSRVGILHILNMMGVKIQKVNIKEYKGEKIADLVIKSTKNIKAINCPSRLNSSAIDEFLLIFLVAAKAKGVSYFKDLSELNEKESPRLKWGSKILNKMGIKNILSDKSIKIYGNPNLKIKKKIVIKDFLKDHRVFMTATVAALIFGGDWSIANKDAINTSFPSFLKKIKYLGAKIR
ncbi:3-phosphoshikimate 1-carboxyvinyltransferase [Candidatus Pelagibacter sp.]|uniref:3-phosphoshikimate 1-carboxyvinyltransferase n=1 Tax=Candidatus Pelagibacter sp. TaxID=2024849 RepID=UPI003F839C38